MSAYSCKKYVDGIAVEMYVHPTNPNMDGYRDKNCNRTAARREARRAKNENQLK